MVGRISYPRAALAFPVAGGGISLSLQPLAAASSASYIIVDTIWTS